MKQFSPTTGGHPLQIDDLMVMQSGVIEALRGVVSGLGASASSGSFILEGCEIIGFNYTSGYIYFGTSGPGGTGEIYPVDAGPVPLMMIGSGHYWQIEEQTLSPSPVTYQDTVTHIVHVRRRMKLVASVGAPSGLPSVSKSSVIKLSEILGLTPQRGIIMYSGPIAGNFITTGQWKGRGIGPKLSGWTLCNGIPQYIPGAGTTTTITVPDLSGRFIVGYDANTATVIDNVRDLTYNTIGSTGGEKKHTLTSQEAGSYAQTVFVDTGSTTQVPDEASAVGAVAHENRPPFLTLAFIMKLI